MNPASKNKLKFVCRVALPFAFTASLAAATCESLATLALPNTSITRAVLVPAGGFELPGGSSGGPAPQQQLFKRLPAFCRVAATLSPTPDSEIKIEVWLPAETWNGKFMGVGNGGWSGAIVYQALAQAVSHNYAAVSTNTGHDGGDASFALDHPEKLTDFAYRAVHEMTLKGKAIAQAFYNKAPARSYWNGCSSGGKQGLKEAQKFPADYDAIVAGAPANYWTHLMVGDLWPGYVTHKDPAAALTRENLQTLHRAVLSACDALDGVEDGLIGDPSRCHFDPRSLVCKEGQTEGCLTAPQAEAARKIYAGASNPRTGKTIFPGMTPGSELVWGALAGSQPFGISVSHFRYVVFKDPAWDYLTLDLDKDVALADKIDNGALNAIDPNLKPFFAHGGKLLLYHGWNDQLISPWNTVDYYKNVVDKMGGASKASGSVRLFMAPGMNHCAGGDGPSSMDLFSTMENWVEQGQAPEQIVATHLTNGKPDRTRPLCPYPQVAKYKGSGSTDDASSFVCAAP